MVGINIIRKEIEEYIYYCTLFFDKKTNIINSLKAEYKMEEDKESNRQQYIAKSTEMYKQRMRSQRLNSTLE